MTMHLHHPALTMLGKRKGKQKFPNAEAKRKHMALQAEWEEKQKQWTSMSKPNTHKVVFKKTIPLSPSIPEYRNTDEIKSLDTGYTGAVSTKQSQQYTGDQVLGITIVHKSCLQPIFSKQEAVDAAKMRR